MPREQKPNQVNIAFVVDKDIHKELTAKAKDNHMSLANYLVFCGMNAVITVSVDSTHKNNTVDKEVEEIKLQMMKRIDTKIKPEVIKEVLNTVSTEPTKEDIDYMRRYKPDRQVQSFPKDGGKK